MVSETGDGIVSHTLWAAHTHASSILDLIHHSVIYTDTEMQNIVLTDIKY